MQILISQEENVNHLNRQDYRLPSPPSLPSFRKRSLSLPKLSPPGAQKSEELLEGETCSPFEEGVERRGTSIKYPMSRAGAG